MRSALATRIKRLPNFKAVKLLPLVEYVPKVSPELEAPYHLAPVVDVLQRALHEPVRVCISTPPQHGKSQLLFHAISWFLRQKTTRILYLTYNEDFSSSQMYDARRIAERANVPFLPDSRAIREWR